MNIPPFGPYGSQLVSPSNHIVKKCIGNSIECSICHLGIFFPRQIDVVLNSNQYIVDDTMLCFDTNYGFSIVMKYHNLTFITMLPHSTKHFTSVNVTPKHIIIKLNSILDVFTSDSVPFIQDSYETFPPIQISLPDTQTEIVREYTGNKGTLVKLIINYILNRRLNKNIMTTIWKITKISMVF